MAWAEKLPSGRWRGVYRDAYGRQRSAGTFPHKATAVRKAGAKEDEVRKSLTLNADAHKQTWGAWCETWWLSRTVEPGTLKRDASRRDQHLKPEWEPVPLGQITRHDVKAWIARMQRGAGRTKPLSNASIQRIVHLFSASLNAAVDAEVIAVNPAARIKLPPTPPTKDRYLSREEYGGVVANLPTADDQLVMHVLAYTGLRFGELAGLHWSRVDLERKQIVVAEVFDEAMGRMKPYPKGKRSRVVPIDGWLADLLRTRKASTKARAGDLVFTSPRGSTLIRSNWDNIFRAAVAATNLGTEEEPVRVEAITIHTLRHSFCSWLAQAGVPLAEIGRLAGHTAAQTTQRYAHLAPSDPSKILAALPAPYLPHEARLKLVAGGVPSQVNTGGPRGARTHNPRIKREPDKA